MPMEGGLLVDELGHTKLRPRGSLSISKPRELTVVAELRGAYEVDGRLARDTVRLWGNRIPGVESIPDELPEQEVVGVCDEEVVWGGFIALFHGHFLLESSARLWPLLPGGELEGLPVVFATPVKFPVVREWLDAFGVRVVDLPPDGATRFTHMFVPEPAWRIDAWLSPEVRDIHLHVRSRLDVPTCPPRDLLWLSRSRLPDFRRAFDEHLLEWLLGEHLKMIRPETMTLADQVGAIEASTALAGIAGSAFHTLLLAKDVPKCLYLCAAGVHSAYIAQDQVLGAKSDFVQGLSRLESRPRSRQAAPAGHRVLIPEILRALAATVLPGLLDDPRLAALSHPERLWFESDTRRSCNELDLAVAKMLIDPHSLEARDRLRTMLDAEGMVSCAEEQSEATACLSAST